MKSTLATGANKGIGLEVAKQLAQQGFFVYLAAVTWPVAKPLCNSSAPRGSRPWRPYSSM